MRLTILIIALIVALAAGLAWLAGSGVVATSVRAVAVAQISQALGREVHVARIAGDPVRGIVMDGVRIAAPPGERGTFFDVSRMVLRFRPLSLLVDLLRGRGPASSLATVELDRPVLVLSRDPAGRWNYPRLPRRRTRGPGLAAFAGTLEVREGTLVVTDAADRLTPLNAHVERITGTVSWTDSPRLRMEVDAVNTDGRTPALLHVAGTILPADGVVDLALTMRGASVAHWAPYLARLEWLRWTGGTVDGEAHFLLSRWGQGTALDYRASLQMHDGRAIVLPQQVTLSAIEGPLVLDNSRVTTEGLALVLDASPVWVRGEITHVADTHLDLAVRSASLNLATLRRLFFPRTSVVISGTTQGEARIVGSVGSFQVEGTVSGGAGRIQGMSFADLSTHIEFSDGMLVVDGLDATVEGGRAHAYVRLSLPTREMFLLADLQRVNASAANVLGFIRLPVRGETSGFISVAGPPGALVGQARLNMARGAVAGMVIDRADAVLGFDQGTMSVDRFEAQSGPATAHATGVITRTGALDLSYVATDASLQALSSLVGPGQWLAGTADLSGQIRGTVGAPEVSSRLDARDGRLGPVPFDQATGTLRISPTGLATPGLVLRDGDGRYKAVGEVRWGEPQRLDLSLQAQTIPAQRLLDIARVPIDVSGIVDGTVKLSGSVRDPVADGTMTLTDGLIGGQRVDRATAAFRWTGGQLHLDDATMQINASRLMLQGSVDRQGRLALSFGAKALDLHDVAGLRVEMMRLDGTADVHGTVSGTLAAPAVEAALSSAAIRLNGRPLDRVNGTLRYEHGRLVLSPLAFAHSGGTLELTGSVLLGEDPVLDLRAEAQQARLATMLEFLRIQTPIRLDGVVDGEMTLTGRVSMPVAVLTAQLNDGLAGAQVIRHATVNAALVRREITLRTLSIVPEQGTLDGAGRIDLTGRGDLEFTGQGLNLGLLQSLGGTKRSLDGDLDFTLQLDGSLTDPLVGLSATVTNGTVGSAPFARMALQAYYQGGIVHVEEGLLQQDQHKLKVSGTVPVNLLQLRVDDTQPVDLTLSLIDGDLSMLSLLTDQVERGQGPLVGEVHVTGVAAQPHLAGTLTARDGMLRMRGLESPFTEVQARLELAEDQIRVGDLRARAGGGILAVSGVVELQHYRPDRANLVMKAMSAHLRYQPYFDGIATGELRLEGPFTRPSVRGSLTLGGGEVVVLPAQPPTPPRPGAVDPVLDLSLTAGDELWVTVGALRLQVHGTVQATGTWDDPRLAGDALSDRGTFNAFNTSFTLTEGQATFADFRGTTPLVDARAETTIEVVTVLGPNQQRVDRARVFLHVYGTPDDLTVDLTADLPLTREEILTALAGRVGVARVLQGQNVENAVKAEIGGAVFGSMGHAMAQAFGLEEFAIAYDVEQPVTLRIGKSVIRNLYVTLSSQLGINPLYVWSLDYRFTPTTMLSFSVDNQGTYDFLYRITLHF